MSCRRNDCLRDTFLLKFQDVEIDKDRVKQRETWLEHLNNWVKEVSQSLLSRFDRVKKQLRGLVGHEFFPTLQQLSHSRF